MSGTAATAGPGDATVRTAGPRTFVPALQSLRGLAALWVVLFHLDVSLAVAGQRSLRVPGLRVGWLGVDLFFVLSAYLLGQPFLDGRAPPLRRFLADRLLRIAPAYYAAAAAAAGMILAFYPDRWHPVESLASLVFVNNSTLQTFYALNPVFWSLAVEVQFYLLLPWLARLFTGRRWMWGLPVCLAASLLARGLSFAKDPANPAFFFGMYGLPSFLGHFGLGLAAARLRRVGRPGAVALLGLLLVGLPATLLVPGTILLPFSTLAAHTVVRPLAACGFALLVLAAASPGAVRRALEVAPLRALGDMSYSLYLIHLPVQLIVLWAVGVGSHTALYLALGIVGSLAGGALLYRLVERPAERWRHRRKARLLA